MRAIPKPHIGGLLVAAAALLCTPAWCGEPAALWARSDYPIPAASATRLFFLQRSTNPNTVVYEARLRADGTLDPDQPLDAYWLRFNTNGERRALGAAERVLLFGPQVEREPGAHAWKVTVAGYPRRSARLILDGEGRPVLVGEIAGRAARLVSAHVLLEGDGPLPRVLAVDLYGVDRESGERLHERFVP